MDGGSASTRNSRQPMDDDDAFDDLSALDRSVSTRASRQSVDDEHATKWKPRSQQPASGVLLAEGATAESARSCSETEAQTRAVQAANALAATRLEEAADSIGLLIEADAVIAH